MQPNFNTLQLSTNYRVRIEGEEEGGRGEQGVKEGLGGKKWRKLHNSMNFKRNWRERGWKHGEVDRWIETKKGREC